MSVHFTGRDKLVEEVKQHEQHDDMDFSDKHSRRSAAQNEASSALKRGLHAAACLLAKALHIGLACVTHIIIPLAFHSSSAFQALADLSVR